MKLNSTKEVWITRMIAWVVVGTLSCGIIFATTFMLGPSLFAVPNLSEKIAGLCIVRARKALRLKRCIHADHIKPIGRIWTHRSNHLHFCGWKYKGDSQ